MNRPEKIQTGITLVILIDLILSILFPPDPPELPSAASHLPGCPLLHIPKCICGYCHVCEGPGACHV